MTTFGSGAVMLRIDLRSLDAGYHSLSLSAEPADLGLEPDGFRDILVEVGLDYDGRQVVLTLTASAIAALVCDRTLVDFEQTIRGEYAVLFSATEPEDDSVDEVRPFSATDEEIDITDIVRDTLLLAVPLKKIAPGAEDADIPLAFGMPLDADIDPRWEALRVLKEGDAEANAEGKKRAPRR